MNFTFLRVPLKSLWPIATVLIPVAGAIVIAWAKDLNASARRRRALDEALKRVEFWDSWLKTAERLSPLTSDDVTRAQDEICHASEQVKRLYERIEFPETLTKEAYAKYKRRQPIWRRLLLLYRQPSSHANGMRLAFWLSCIYYSAAIVLIFVTPHSSLFGISTPAYKRMLGILYAVVGIGVPWVCTQWLQESYFRRTQRTKPASNLPQ